MRERTRQQFDPVGSGESRTLWVLLAAGSGLYGVVMTAAGWGRTAVPWLAVAGALLAVAAAVLVITATSPRRAPFTRLQHLTLHVVALAALGASLWARHEVPFGLGDAFATVTIAGLIAAINPYRPPTELVSHGFTTAIIAGFAVLTAAHGGESGVPALVLALTAVAPIVVTTVGAAVYSETILRILEHTGQRPAPAATEDATAHRDRVVVMSQDAVPLLQRVLEQGEITERDRDDAVRAADALRAVLVSEVNRTWLDAIQSDAAGPRFTVTDPGGLARSLSTPRRTVLRALLAALASEPGFVGGDVELTRGPLHNILTISARFDAAEYTTPPGHPVVSALFTVMRSVFTELESTRARTRVLVTFRYEHD